MRPLRPPSPRLLFPPFFQSVMPPRRHPLLLPPIPCPPAHHTPLSLILACGRWRCSSRGRKRGGCVAAICICSDRYAREGGGRRRPPPSLCLVGLTCTSWPKAAHTPALHKSTQARPIPTTPAHHFLSRTNSPSPSSPAPPTHADEQTLASERRSREEISHGAACPVQRDPGHEGPRGAGLPEAALDLGQRQEERGPGRRPLHREVHRHELAGPPLPRLLRRDGLLLPRQSALGARPPRPPRGDGENRREALDPPPPLAGSAGGESAAPCFTLPDRIRSGLAWRNADRSDCLLLTNCIWMKEFNPCTFGAR